MLIYLLLFITSLANGLEDGMSETFIKDIIETWRLRSPTIIFPHEAPKMCLDLQWILCLTGDMGTDELTQHLHKISPRKEARWNHFYWWRPE